MSSVVTENERNAGERKDRVFALVCAVLLSALTLSVFAYSIDSGPASTVRRYHVALFEGNRQNVAEIEFDGMERDSAILQRYVVELLRQSQSVQLGRVQKDGRVAYVDVTYALPRSGNISAIRFVVRKPNHRWRIHSRDTLETLFRMMGY
ncbi:hypothetical protein QPK87_09710 [Kamptonema cortianum]|nr:hypothetical protein [Geitlerinema splendidum]MDK3156850.1 hypothetical protein [Kamptonema cortianum]